MELWCDLGKCPNGIEVNATNVRQYAMLAGYLPFDDDPANPEGDNINLLYKYIVSTPLTFPEYVTPHARDLLRRILVPDPRRRADLFEVARHSWLSEFSHVVGFIGSSTKSDRDIASSALQQGAEPTIGRSASVREPGSRSPAPMSAGGPVKPPPTAHTDDEGRSKQRDAKRRTVQVEYVAPQGATARGEPASQAPPVAVGRTRARGDGTGPVEVTSTSAVPRKEVPSQAMPPPSRPGKDQSRPDSIAFASPPTSSARPNTGGGRLSSRGNSYSQPAAATSSNETAHGRFSQPKPTAGYIISSPNQSDRGEDSSRPVSQHNLAQFQGQQQEQDSAPRNGHKRSSTLGSIGDRLLGRSNSRRSSKGTEPATTPVQSEKRDRKYPPVSMRNAVMNNTDDATPRPSTDSKRRPSFNFGRKNSDTPSDRRSSRRFSFLPNNFSFGSLGGAGAGGKKDAPYNSDAPIHRHDSQQRASRPQSKGMAFGRGQSPSSSHDTSQSTIPLHYDDSREAARAGRRQSQPYAALPQHIRQDTRYDKALPPQPPDGPPAPDKKRYRDDGYGGNLLDSSSRQQEPVGRYYATQESLDRRHPQSQSRSEYPNNNTNNNQNFSSAARPSPKSPQQQQQHPDFVGAGFNQTSPLNTDGRSSQQQIRPQQRKFGDAYDQGHAGSSSGARRVMDFFRRRGKDRSMA